MADNKKLVEVSVVVGAKADTKSVNTAAKELAAEAATQKLKIPVSLVPQGLDKILASLPSAPSSSNTDFKKLKGDVNDFVRSQKKRKQAEDDFFEALESRALSAERASILEATNATNFANAKKQADDKFIDNLFKRTEGAEKLAIEEATQSTNFAKQKKTSDDKFINALFKRTEGAEKLAIQEATEATEAAQYIARQKAAKIAADDKFINAIFKRTEITEKAALREAREETINRNEINAAIHARAKAIGDQAIKDSKEILNNNKGLKDSGRPSDKAAADAARSALEEAKLNADILAAKAARKASEKAHAEEAARNLKAAKAARVALDNAKDEAIQKRISGAEQELLTNQKERIIEIRKAIELQRIQNKSLEKQGKLASPVALQSSSVSTSSLSDGISSATQSILSLTKFFGRASVDAFKFSKEVIGSAAEQKKLKDTLSQQNTQISNLTRIQGINVNLLNSVNSEINQQKEIYSKSSRTLKDSQRQTETNNKIQREMGLKLLELNIAQNDIKNKLKDTFGVEPGKQAGDLQEFLLDNKNFTVAKNLSNLITTHEKLERRYRDLLEKRENVIAGDIGAIKKKSAAEKDSLSSFTALKNLYSKKKILEEENISIEQKIVGVQGSRLKTLSQLAAAEARGLVNRAANFLAGGGGGNSNRGNGSGPPPKNPGGGGNNGNNRGDDSFRKGISGINAFNTGLARSLTFLEKLRLNLNEADKAALQFGQTSRVATDRLLAFAAPSTLIYKTVSAIRTASQELINLDTQARRLVFFEEAGRSGGLGKFNLDINDSTKRSKLLGDAFKNIAEEANRTGLAMETVTEAAQTVARIGEISFLPDGASSDFLKATLGLTQIEAGALNSERAAEILKATLAQFGLEASQVTTVAAKFATVANETSVNVEQLATLVTRFGSAAINVQNLNFDQTLALASISAKTLGTNTFRTATALRQLTTKLVDNIDKVKELSGIDITVGEGGQLRGIESLLQVLEKVNDLGQTGSGVELAKLIGDRENLSDIFALAKVVPELRSSISKLADTQNTASQTSQQIAAFLNVVGLQSDSVESSINRLNTTFKTFLNSAGTTSIIDGIVKGLTSIAKTAGDVSNAIGGIGGIIAGLGPIAALAFGDVAKKGILSLIGFISGPSSKAQFKKSIEELLNTPVKRTETIELLSKQGLVSIERGNQFLVTQNKLLLEQQSIDAQIKGTKALIRAEEKQIISDLVKIEELELKILNLEKQRTGVIIRQQNVTKGLIQDNLSAIKLFEKSFKENAGGILSAGLATAGLALSQIIPSFISSPETKDKVASAISSGFSGAALGAQIGGIFGPYGAIGGAVIGGFASSVDVIAEGLVKKLGGLEDRFGLFGLQDQEENDAVARQQKRQLAAINAKKQADAFAVEQAKTKLAFIENEIKAEERLNRLRTINIEINQIQSQIDENRKKGLSIEDLKLRMQVKVAERKTLELQTSKDIANEEARRLKILEQIANLELQQDTKNSIDDIKKQTALQFNKLNRGGDLEALRIGIEFDRRQVQNRIDNLIKQRNLRVDAILSLTPDKQEEKDRLQKELLDIEKKLINERIQANKQIRDEQFALLEKQQEVAKDVIDSYRQAADSLIEAQGQIFSQNKAVISLLNDQRNLVDRRASNRNAGIRNPNETNDITNAIQSLRNRQNAVTPEAQANRKASTGLEDDFKKVSARLKELQAISQISKDKITNEIAARQALLENEQSNFEQRISFERDNLDNLKNIAEQLVSKQQELIAAEIKMIEVIKERAKREAEFGRNLLESPEEAFKNLKNLDLAQQFLNIDKELNSRSTRQRFDADKSGALSKQEREVARNSIISDRLEKLLGQAGGRGIAQQILDGLKFGAGLPNDPFNSSSFGGAAQAEELLARLIGGGSVARKPGETNQEDRQQATIDNRRKELDDTFKAMNDIINQQIALERQVRDVETERLTLLQKQVSQLKEIDLNNALNAAAVAAIRFKETVDASKPAFDKINEIATKSVTNESVERLLKELGSASENLNRIASDNGLQGEQIASSLGTTFNEAIVNLSDTLNSIKVNVLAEVPDINVQLEGRIKQTLDGEQLAEQLKNVLVGTGVEDRLDEIQGILTRLVEISKAQGNKFPPNGPR